MPLKSNPNLLMSSDLMPRTSCCSSILFQVAASAVRLSASLSALTSSSVSPSVYAIHSSGISSYPSFLSALTRVWPLTMTGCSGVPPSCSRSQTIAPRKPNSSMDAATPSTACNL